MASAGKVLMITESQYPEDIRVRYEAEALTRDGKEVSVISLGRKGSARVETVNGVKVYRIPELTVFKKTNKEGVSRIGKRLTLIKSVIGYVVEYTYFTSMSMFHAIYLYITNGFDVVHAHNPPDTLFIIGAFAKLVGKKYVFDHHDLSPELYLSRYENRNPNIVYKMLIIMEKLSLKLANVVIATNDSYKEIEIKRGQINPEKIYIVRNGPKLSRIRHVPSIESKKDQSKMILVYVGIMNPQDGVDYLIRSLHRLVIDLKRKDFHCIIIGKGDSLGDLIDLNHKLGLDELVTFTGFISEEDLLKNMFTADICLDPNPSNPLNDVSTWIKVMEYMAMRKPIVSYDLKETRFTVKDAAIYAKPNDELEFARAIMKLMDDKELRNAMGEYGFQRVKNMFTWEHSEKNLIQAYKYLYNN